MRKSRRRALVRIIERVAVGLALLDLVLWLGVVQAYNEKVVTEQQRLETGRRQLQQEKVRVAQLERRSVAGADSDLKDFLRDHVPPRRNSFSRAARLLSRLEKEAGVQLTNVNYRLNHSKDEPLERLAIDATVQGPFTSLVDFAHGLETASDFILLRSFVFENGEGGTLALKLDADLYVTP